MPDQNNPATPVSPTAPTATPPINQLTPQVNQPVNPIVTTDPDVPPLPPDFQNIQPTATPAPIVPPTEKPEDIGSAAPANLPPMVSTPKKKFGGKRIIATILGVLLLVGGVGAGLLLTQQQQLFEQQAAGGWCPGGKKRVPKGGTQADCPGGGGTTSGGNPQAGTSGWNYTTGQMSSNSDWSNPNMQIAGTYVSNGKRYPIGAPGVTEGLAKYNAQNGNVVNNNVYVPGKKDTKIILPSPEDIAAHPGQTWVPSGTGCNGTKASETPGDPSYCHDWHWTTCLHPGTGVNGVGCDVQTVTTNNNPPSNPPPNNPTAQCSNVSAYDTSWKLMTAGQLSGTAIGTTVNFCVGGATSGGGFDKAKFTINGVTQAETTTKGSGDASSLFCQSYQIPTGVTSFNVKGQIHDSTLGWSN